MAKKNTLEENGKVDINRDILLSIINLATKEISGVESLTNAYMSWAKRTLTKPKSEGVSIKFDGNNVLKIDVYIRVYMGVNVPEVAFRVQENIKNSLSAMVGIKPGKINVHVYGVNCDKVMGEE